MFVTRVFSFSFIYSSKVRQLGKFLNVPESFLKRHPFPGPGLAVRVLGDVTEGNALNILREVCMPTFKCFFDYEV